VPFDLCGVLFPATQIQEPRSRLFVTCRALVSDSGVSLRFALPGGFGRVLGSIWLHLARKNHFVCSISKSQVLCFQIFLSFVSTVFVFPPAPPDLHQLGSSEPCRISPPQPETCATLKSSNCASNVRIKQSIWVHFGFVFGFVFRRYSFVFNDSLAWFPLFFIFSSSRLSPRAPGHSQPCSRWVDFRGLSTTMCPQNDHNSRLSPPFGFVKRKTRKE